MKQSTLEHLLSSLFTHFKPAQSLSAKQKLNQSQFFAGETQVTSLHNLDKIIENEIIRYDFKHFGRKVQQKE